MQNDPGQPESPGKQALNLAVLLLKMLALLAGLAAFGFVIYFLRRMIG